MFYANRRKKLILKTVADSKPHKFAVCHYPLQPKNLRQVTGINKLGVAPSNGDKGINSLLFQ